MGRFMNWFCTDDSAQLASRSERAPSQRRLAVHYGKIAGAESATKSAAEWTELASTRGILCFDMVATQPPVPCPTLAVRGISGYVDSHGNGKWKEYATLAAAAYAKSFLREMPPVQAAAAAAFEPENAASNSRANLNSRAPLARPRQSARRFTPETTSSP